MLFPPVSQLTGITVRSNLMTEQERPRTDSLDALWFDLLADALSSDGPISDADVKNAVKRARPKIEEQARTEGRQQAVREIRAEVHEYIDHAGMVSGEYKIDRDDFDTIADRVAGLTSEGSAAQLNASESPDPEYDRQLVELAGRRAAERNASESPPPRPEEVAAVKEQVRMLQEGVPNIHRRLGDASESGQSPEGGL